MEYGILLELATDLGYELAMCGAETFRIEESVSRVLQAYGIQSEVFSIPNSLTVSIEGKDGQPMTRLRRIGIHGNDLDGVELFSGLSRRLCQKVPPAAEAVQWLEQTKAHRRSYPTVLLLLGHFLGAFGFSMLFGGSFLDGICSGFCGLIIGIINRFTGGGITCHDTGYSVRSALNVLDRHIDNAERTVQNTHHLAHHNILDQTKFLLRNQFVT